MMLVLSGCAVETEATSGETGFEENPADEVLEAPWVILTQTGIDLTITLPRYPGAEVALRRGDTDSLVTLDSYGSYTYRVEDACSLVGSDVSMSVSLDSRRTWWTVSKRLEGYTPRGTESPLLGSLGYGPLVVCGHLFMGDTVQVYIDGGYDSEVFYLRVDAPLDVSVYNPNQPFPPDTYAPNGASTEGYVSLLDQAPFYYVDLKNNSDDGQNYTFVMYSLSPEAP